MDEKARELLKSLVIQNLKDQAIKYVERLIHKYVSGYNTHDQTINFFKCELMELSDNIDCL